MSNYKMRLEFRLGISFLLILSFVISSCGDKDYYKEEDDDNDVSKTYNVVGKVEKGPFVSGSTISIQLMDSKLEVLGEVYNSTIQDDKGSFSFGSKSFQTPYAELTANGYFFNEVRGELSSGTLNLQALVDLSDKTTVNVNILTHLKYQRILKLIKEGKKFSDANKQAQKELFTAFGLQKYSEMDASRFSITEGSNESAALIAVSSLLLIDRSEAELTEYLAKLCREFGENGSFINDTKVQMKFDREELFYHLSSIKENVIERYKGLGLNVEVKELALFMDWDNDGIAGNEILKNGEEVVLKETSLEVPNEGGTYRIEFTSPIPVYLERQIGDDEPISTGKEEYYHYIYEENAQTDISLEKELESNLLILKISPLNLPISKTTSVILYDCLGNEVATVAISQEGNADTSLPKLGNTGVQMVTDIAYSIGRSFSSLNWIEQYYYSNKRTNDVELYIYPESSTVKTIWSEFYTANRLNLGFKYADAERLGLYQNYFDVFSAIIYFNLILAWGDVPYIDNWDWYQNYNSNIPRTSQIEILDSLKEKLISAIDNLEEKKNESLQDTNGYFFVSKDVARILLADIYMYQGDYSSAQSLLSKVIENGYYELDESNYSNMDTIDNLWQNGSTKETIFVAKYDLSPRSITHIPTLIPLMNYTDVILSYAECLYKNGNITHAKTYLDKVATAKSITVSNDVFTGIKDARMQLFLYSVGNFAFLKRNDLAKEEYGVEEYRLLLPIPGDEMRWNFEMEQNPGY